MKILFWVPYPTEGPSNRFRVEQYLPYLKEKGIQYSLRPFWDSDVYKILYENGHCIKKICYFLKGCIKRLKDLISLSNYDLVFVHREAFPIGGAFLERIASLTKPIIYDFDDSVFLSNYSSANRIMHFLKSPRKIAQIIKLSKVVIAGNNHLRNYAVKYNKNVLIIPTVIDTDKYCPVKSQKQSNKIVIGWIGTYTTNQYLCVIRNVFLRLLKKYKDRVEIRLIGCKDNFLDIPGIVYKNWSLSKEIEDLKYIDIGVMPIWEDEWTKGKCAFKIIQYMATGASVIASPIGMNKEVVIDGENGFLATDEDAWLQKLTQLIEDTDLRERFALRGRQTAEREYSLKALAPKFIDILEKTYESSRN